MDQELKKRVESKYKVKRNLSLLSSKVVTVKSLKEPYSLKFVLGSMLGSYSLAIPIFVIGSIFYLGVSTTIKLIIIVYFLFVIREVFCDLLYRIKYAKSDYDFIIKTTPWDLNHEYGHIELQADKMLNMKMTDSFRDGLRHVLIYNVEFDNDVENHLENKWKYLFTLYFRIIAGFYKTLRII